MPQLSFIHAGFLSAAAVAAGLPVLIHLLLRQRARNVEIGSVRFLRDVIREHTRRRRIRQWVLLALRVLAVLLLGLLFARPFLDRSGLLGLNQEILVLVDRSASMQIQFPDEETAFSRARAAARKTIEGFDKNAIVRIGLFDNCGVQEIEREQLKDETSAGDGNTDYTGAFQWARDILTVSPRPSRAIHLWTDLQKSGLRGAVSSFPDDVRLFINDVGRDLTNNLCVDSAEATAVEIRPENPVTVTCRVRNTGILPAQSVAVSLELQGPGDIVKASKIIDLAGGRQTAIEFPLKVQEPGLYRGELKLEYDDELPRDNRRFLAFQVRYPDRVLLADGQLGDSVYGNETYFLEMTLRLDVPLGSRPSRTFEVERIDWEDGEGFPDLNGFRCVVMANVGFVDATNLNRLREYVAAGGRLLVFAGNQVLPSAVEAFHKAGLAAGTIAIAPNIGRFRITSFADHHPAFMPFCDPNHGDLRRLEIRQMLHWENLDESSKPLVLANDQPLVVEHSFQKGKIVFVGTTADRSWNEWPQDRLYVPIIRQLTAYLTDQLSEQQLVSSAVVNDKDQHVGIEKVQEVLVVRNLDPRESRVERITSDVLRAGLALPEVVKEEIENRVTVTTPRTAWRQDEIWPVLIWLLLAVLGAETLLASRIHA